MEAYGADIAGFLGFLTQHLGGEPDLPALAGAAAADLRAWLAAEAAEGAGNATRARHLSAVRSFYRFLARRHGVDNPALKLIATPRGKRPVPRALATGQAREVTERIAEMSDAAAMQARDTALFTLLYGCGLRIAEALALDVRDAPARRSLLRVVGKGNKERIVPVLPAVREAVAAWLALHPDRQPDSPLFVGARGGRLDAAVAQRTLRQLPPAVRPAGTCDAARAAALVRHASAGGRGGPALDPGPAGPCQPVHHAALYRGGRGAADGGMAQGAPAGVTREEESDAGIRSGQGAGVQPGAARREGARHVSQRAT